MDTDKLICKLKIVNADIVHTLHDWVESLEFERCSNISDISPYHILAFSDGSVVEYIKTDVRGNPTGEANGFRGSCLQRRSKFIIHSHPRTSYAYPSIEDVIRVLKEQQSSGVVIEYSIIATLWGIWVIYHNSNNNYILETDFGKAKIHHSIAKRLNEIGIKTKTSDAYRESETQAGRSPRKSKHLDGDSELYRVVVENAGRISVLCGIKLHLYLWSSHLQR